MQTPVAIILTDADKTTADKLADSVNDKHLPLVLSHYILPNLTQRSVIATLEHVHCSALLIDRHNVYFIGLQNGKLMKTHLNWQSLASRIVKAGRKSELLLQACKVTADMSVIDGTAGFGYDGLILASTGASVCLIEQNPIVALMLFYEYQTMTAYPNWHKLLSRVMICYDDFLMRQSNRQVDVIYLDPMFPSNSYTAKVGKNMQLLHTLTLPPTLQEEHRLFSQAWMLGNKVVVKRPVSAPYLAEQVPVMSINNDAIRFDIYEK